MTASWPKHAPRWTAEQIEADVSSSRADFRSRRMGEPLQRYLDAFDGLKSAVEPLINTLRETLSGSPTVIEHLRQSWRTDDGRTAFRYLGAPPISDDDLAILAEAKLAGRALDGDGAAAQRLVDVMRVIADPRRFPWLASGLAPTAEELRSATLATTALMASQRVQTLRRGDEKSSVEGAVKGLLIGMGWHSAICRNPRGIQNLVTDLPPPRTFMSQTNLGADNADVLVRLDDDRLLAIECKGSNSAINSRKRLNKEAAQNAGAWIARFGSAQVVPAVTLQGVFNPRYVAEAQDTPMVVFWGHRLDDIKAFIQNAV